MTRARARHILVSTEAECIEIKAKLEAGAEFESLAKQHSSCPSGQGGGDLGEFGPGQMVKQFDEVVFHEEVGKVHGPVKTQFGYHLLEITKRS
ncbi:MAG: peptidylprolyl isomerase [Planctomycetota bacterium]|nr:MAG: peptidylprolyl isomerase [Planctomycetota bacterium]